MYKYSYNFINMSYIPENVRQVLLQLVPAAILKDIACFVFYDNHPLDENNIDITLCTKMGDVREYFQRDVVLSVCLESNSELREMRILRNSQGRLFYLVASGEQLIIISKGEKLQIHKKLSSVVKYEISDISCTGHAVLKVTFKDNDIPVVLDDDFENVKAMEFSSYLERPVKNESGPILTHLMRKLMEAKYSVKCNEKSYNNFLNMRQAVAYSTYKQIHPNLNDSVFKDGLKNLAATLNIHTRKPWIKSCNKKIVIIYNVCNKNNEPLEDVHILLHGTTRESIEYTTMIFEKITTPPFWNDTKSIVLKPHTECAITVVIDFDELKFNIISKLKYNGVLIYKRLKKECILPINDVELSSLDTMGKDFDVLCSEPMDANITLAVLASTDKTDLILRQMKIKTSNDNCLNADLFCTYLNMEQVLENIVINRQSPYHVLNGVVVVLDSESQRKSDQLAVTVYSRSSSQVLALIHHIHDAVPVPILITTPNQNITAKSDNLSISNEISSGDFEPYNYEHYAQSMLKRTTLVIEYLDNCMISMNQSKESVVRNKIGSEIDLYAQGEARYMDFKEKMREEAINGVKMLNDDVVVIDADDVVCID